MRAGAAAAATGLAWGWYEAGWVRLRTLHCPVAGLPPELAGIRIAHLSDFHLGMPSSGSRAVRAAVAWTLERRPDIVVVTGDLVSRRRGRKALDDALRPLAATMVLGNHDVEAARDPFSRAADLDGVPGTLLLDESASFELRGRRVQIVGVDPRTWKRGAARPERLADPAADLRILLSHYPSVIERLPPRVFHLVLAGHLHAGQIVVPYGRGRFMLKHPSTPYISGLLLRPGGTLHVSPGLGTSLVPFRFFARPEATELELVPLVEEPLGPDEEASLAQDAGEGPVRGRLVREVPFRARSRAAGGPGHEP